MIETKQQPTTKHTEPSGLLARGRGDASPSGRWLAHPKDIHSVIFHLLCLAAYGIAFWLWKHPELARIEGPWSAAAFVAAAAIMLGWISGVDVGVNFHNHTHRRVFRKAWMNRWFSRIWTVNGGWPAFFWEYSHVTVHHAHVLSQRDWTLPVRKADGTWENYYRYCLLHWPWRYAVHFVKDFQKASRRIRRKAVTELAAFSVLWSIPFLIDPVMALLLWVLPQWIANAAVMGPGMYAQHAGRDEPDHEHEFRHSNCFVSRFFNATMFNIGYHALHHTYPWVHWSDLPELHEQMRERLIEDGAHVVPFGYYRGGMLLAAEARNNQKASATFHAQHPDYLRPEDRLAEEKTAPEAVPDCRDLPHPREAADPNERPSEERYPGTIGVQPHPSFTMGGRT